MSEINDTKEILEDTFPNNMKLIKKYQRIETNLRAKYKDGTYHTGSFYGISNIGLNLIAFEDKIIIPTMIQSYILHWYHTHLLHPGMDRTEAKIFQHFILIQ